jgi:hypothetical protein
MGIPSSAVTAPIVSRRLYYRKHILSQAETGLAFYVCSMGIWSVWRPCPQLSQGRENVTVFDNTVGALTRGQSPQTCAPQASSSGQSTAYSRSTEGAVEGYPPLPRPLRPFLGVYHGPSRNVANQPLAFDIDGRRLTGEFVAGRRRAFAPNQSVSPEGIRLIERRAPAVSGSGFGSCDLRSPA